MTINLEQLEDKAHDYLDHMQIEGLNKERIQKEVIRFSEIYFEGVKLSKKDLAIVVGRLMERLEIEMNIGSFIASSSFKPWLSDKRKEMQNNNKKQLYWDRYLRLLEKKNFPQKVRTAIDSDTENILDLTADPSLNESWSRKGLVVGHVQSGKTANYTGLICKAADVGYKLIIILAGMSNDLRNQTQTRSDEGFVGIDTGRFGSGLQFHELLTGVGYIDANIRADCLTTSDKDFNRAFAQRIGSLAQNPLPFIAVIKKNKNSFDNLINWLTATESNFNDIPLLLIDDEADHASINTNKDYLNPTTINKKISELLGVFPKNAYVGYTATPFANVFISPGETDIFPEDFIFTLDTPSNYFGPEKVFGMNERLDIVKAIPFDEYYQDDDEEIYCPYIPLKHKKDLDLDDLPPSLEEAIIVFILSCTVRNLRGQVNQHKTMMINVSVYKDVQHSVRLLTHQFVKEIKEAISVNFALGDSALDSSIIRRFHKLWEQEFPFINWDELLNELNNAVDPLTVIEVNTSQHGDSLSYDEKVWPNGRTVITIGGYSLSRGLTLEGLTISYLLRNTKMYDTLMQMGRWFGYRKDYEDICRVYMPQESIEWYEFITEATEELRQEFSKMKRAGLTPKEFGLRVRSHPASLLITAKNKMRSSKTELREIIDLKGRQIETTVLSKVEKEIKKNFEATERLLSKVLEEHNDENDCKSGYLFKEISHQRVSDFINNYSNHPLSQLTESEPITNYINALAEKDTNKWNLLVVNESRSKSDLKQEFAGLTINAGKRSVPPHEEEYVTTRNKKLTSTVWEEAGLSAATIKDIRDQFKSIGKEAPGYAFREKMELPLLKVYLVDCVLSKTDIKTSEKGYIGWSISFPGEMGKKEDGLYAEYAINITAQQQELPFIIEEEEEDEYE